MNTALRRLTVALLSCLTGLSASAQTYTTIMSGERSTSFSCGGGGTCSRTPVTSLQSPFGFPSSYLNSNDSQTYPSGSAGGVPEPWWFSYFACGAGANLCTQDLTGAPISRGPAYGQISSRKSSVLGLLAQAALNGTASNGGSSDPADVYETFYFSQRRDYAGQREIGFVRQMSPYATVIDPANPGDYSYFYWYTNDNCGVGGGSGPNMGYPYCRTSQANGTAENPATAPLLATEFNFEFLPPNTLTIGTTYIFREWIFRASWDSTYKLRCEVWDSTFTTQIFAANLDTVSADGSARLGITTSGTSGFVTLGTERSDPNNTLTSSGIALSVNYVQIMTP